MTLTTTTMVLVLSAAGLVSKRGSGPGTATSLNNTLPPAVPQGVGGFRPFTGLGVWIDIYDPDWSDPEAAVKEMAAHGVGTLYLQTSNYSLSAPLVHRSEMARFVDAAHRYHIQIVAWYMPGLVDIGTDLSRSMAAINFTTAAGNRFSGFALDIESTAARDPTVRTRRLLALSARLHASAGETYPLGAIVPSPVSMVRFQGYWPGFPWKGISRIYGAFLPMCYYTSFTKGYAGALSYTSRCLQMIRSKLGTDTYPVSVIGGIAQDATASEKMGFIRAIRGRGLVGASYYSFPGITSTMWSELSKLPSELRYSKPRSPSNEMTLGRAATIIRSRRA